MTTDGPAHEKTATKLESILKELAELVSPIFPVSGCEAAKAHFQRALGSVLFHIGALVDCELGSIFVVSPQDGKLHGLVQFGYEGGIADKVYTPGKKADGSDLYRDESKGKRGGGVTAYVATTGTPQWFATADKNRAHRAWRGMVDERQWKNGREFRNCTVLPLKVGDEIIGVVRFENFKSDPNLHKEVIEAILPYIALALESYRRQLTPGEKQYLLTKEHKEIFQEVILGDVLLEHLLTSICASDVTYFAHRKPKEKLADRLPMVLGHEVVAIVREGGLGQAYEPRPSEAAGKQVGSRQIKVGDHVVVIPQIPCTVCETCHESNGTVDKPGENYCANVKHMASNADGSLRTKFRYKRELLIPYSPREVPNELAVLTEPFAQLVQVCRELGFKRGRQGFDLHLDQFNHLELWNAFQIHRDDFDLYFKIFASDHQLPRTLLSLPAPTSTSEDLERRFSHYALMRRGLFLSASRRMNVCEANPRVLILGSGPVAFMAALLLRHAYGLETNQLYVYGRRDDPLQQFTAFGLGSPINVAKGTIEGRDTLGSSSRMLWDAARQRNDREEMAKIGGDSITEYLRTNGITFHVVLECIGGEATQQLIRFAIGNASKGGVIALFGLSEKPIEINFRTVLDKELTFKGFYRACRESYFEALDYLKESEFAEQAQELVIDRMAVPPSPRIRCISDSDGLVRAFKDSEEHAFWGKMLVQLADTVPPIVSVSGSNGQVQ